MQNSGSKRLIKCAAHACALPAALSCAYSRSGCTGYC